MMSKKWQNKDFLLVVEQQQQFWLNIHFSTKYILILFYKMNNFKYNKDTILNIVREFKTSTFQPASFPFFKSCQQFTIDKFPPPSCQSSVEHRSIHLVTVCFLDSLYYGDKKHIFNPLSANVELSRHENLTFLWT